MKAEISHHGYRDERHYSGVYLQQGTMITDRDFNALCDRLRAQIESAADRFAGPGTPKRGGLVTGLTRPGAAPEWTAEFSATGGWVGADGVYALALPTEDGPFSYRHQPDLPDPPALTPGILYADIWDDVVTAFDAPDLVDPGLHGAHTAFVRRRRVQIKQCAPERLVPTDCGLMPDPDMLPAIGSGRFTIEMREGAAGDDRCDPCAEVVDVERAVGNYLFRVEVHDVEYQPDGTPARCTLKWSAENGAIQHPRDDVNRPPEPGFVHEYFADAYPLYMGLPAGGPTDRPPRGQMWWTGQPLPPAALDRVRRWDGHAELDLGAGTLITGRDRDAGLFEGGDATQHGHVEHSGGRFAINLAEVKITLDIGPSRALLAGDYWLALARSRTEGPAIRALSHRPIGIRHHYCVLGPSTDGRNFLHITAADKRRLSFPDLTCLAAADVAYDTRDCGIAADAEVTSVQEALDEFCARLHPYNVLRMSQGTGQEGPLNEVLPGPLEAIVEDRDGRPVAGVRVRFRVLTKDIAGNSAGRLDASATGGFSATQIDVTSDASGKAQAFWRLTRTHGLHQAEAALTGSLGKRAPHLIFAARTEIQVEATELPVVKKIAWVSAGDFENDASVNPAVFGKGLAITLSQPLAEPDLVTGDVLSFTAEKYIHDDNIQNFAPLILCGQVQANGREIFFQPDPRSLKGLLSDISDLPDCAPREGMRVRLRLTGRFVHTEGGLLDGHVPGVPRGNRVALDYDKAGLGHASDLEAWFYLTLDRNGLRLYLVENRELAGRLGSVNGPAVRDFGRMSSNAMPPADMANLIRRLGLSIDLDSGRTADENVAKRIFRELRERGFDPGDFNLLTTEALGRVGDAYAGQISGISDNDLRIKVHVASQVALPDRYRDRDMHLLLIDDDTRDALGPSLPANELTELVAF